MEIIVLAGLVVAALGMAAHAFASYWADPAVLWRDPYHDRNTHYLSGLNLALDMAAWDPVGFVANATADPIWPPFHALFLGLVLLVGGVDHRLAILPSLAGWVATIVLTGLLARRVATGRIAGWFAAGVAGAFALASPALRLLGADVMLEGLGAALGAMALHAFIRSDDTAPNLKWTRLLAVLLTCLFLEKFNYWLLVIVALAITLWLDENHRATIRSAIAAWPRLARALVLSWLGLFSLAVLVAAFALSLTEPRTVTVLGRSFLILPTFLLTTGYGLLLLRACQLWRQARRGALAALSPAGLIVMRWHVMPVALWFLVPQALSRFLWFVSPTHRGASTGYDPWAALTFQWSGFAHGFHAPAIAWAVLLLAGLGGTVLARRTDRTGCVAVFAALCTVVLVLHPQQQWRFQATMLFAIWACAGVGAAKLLTDASRAIRLSDAARSAAAAAVLALLLSLLAIQAPAALAQRVAIRTPDAPSDLELAAAYLPLLRGARTIGVVTTFGVSDLFAWSLREACRCRVPVDQPWLLVAADQAEAAAVTRSWLDTSPADRVLLIDAPAPYPLPGQPGLHERLAGIGGVLDAHLRLTPLLDRPVAVGQARVMAWRSTAPHPGPPPRRLRLTVAMSIMLALSAVGLVLWPQSGPSGGVNKR